MLTSDLALDPRILALLSTHYGLESVRVLRRFATNGRREAYLLQTEAGLLVLKLTDPGRPEELVRSDTAILTYLAHFDFPAPLPVPARDGSLYLPFEERFFYLYRFLAGEKPRPSAAMLAACGALLARLHSLPVDAGARASLHRPPYLLEELRGYLRAAPDEPEQRAMAMELEALIAGFPSYAELPEGLIHTDPYYVNLVAGADGGLRLIDWEDAGISYPLIDVGYVGHLATFLPQDVAALKPEFGTPEGPETSSPRPPKGAVEIAWRPDWAAAFLDGYQSVRRLSALERELFPSAVRLNFLIYIWDWDRRRIIPENFRRMRLLEELRPTWR